MREMKIHSPPVCPPCSLQTVTTRKMLESHVLRVRDNHAKLIFHCEQGTWASTTGIGRQVNLLRPGIC